MDGVYTGTESERNRKSNLKIFREIKKIRNDPKPHTSFNNKPLNHNQKLCTFKNGNIFIVANYSRPEKEA
jgi:hypothetical protein